MIELAMKCLGFGKLLAQIDALDGLKTYIGASCEMLTGLAAMLCAVASLLPHFMEGKGVQGIYTVLTGPDFPIAKVAFSGGWVALVHGFKGIGQAHAAEKALAVAVSLAATPAAQPTSVPPAA